MLVATTVNTKINLKNNNMHVSTKISEERNTKIPTQK